MPVPDETPREAAGDARGPGASAPWSPESSAWLDERAYILDGIGPRRRAFNRFVVKGLNGLDAWFRRHWLGLVNAGLGVFIGLAVAAPILRTFGLVGPSQSILLGYHVFCAQTPSHSFYIAGHQVCLCERCLAIYSSLLLGGLLLTVLRDRGVRVPLLRWQWWVLAMIPMALDGGTQLFGWRESDLFLRVLTGMIFGLATAWFVLPHIQDVAEPDSAVAQASVSPRPRPA
jgi:uncharacterized membrane protein